MDVVRQVAAALPGGWASNASTGMVPAGAHAEEAATGGGLVHSSPKFRRLWLETTRYAAVEVAVGRTSMPSKASRAEPTTLAGSDATVGRPASSLTSSIESAAVARDLGDAC